MGLKRALCALVLVALAGCSAVSDARLAPGERDRAQRAAPPSLNVSPHYETASVSADVAVPLDAFARWFERTGAPGFGSFLHGTARVPGVTRTDPLAGGWHDPGDRRRLVFADGASATEQILERDPHHLRIELWDLKTDTGRYIAYAIEDVTLSETPSQAPPEASTGTRVTWTVAFEPKIQPPDGWMIRSAVSGNFRAFMQAGLNAMAERAAGDLAPTPRTMKGRAP